MQVMQILDKTDRISPSIRHILQPCKVYVDMSMQVIQILDKTDGIPPSIRDILQPCKESEFDPVGRYSTAIVAFPTSY